MATIFVDFGAANDGDGTSYVQAASGGAVGAYKTIVGKTFTTGDVVWIRRSSTVLALAAALTISTVGVKFVGWPISGDTYYSIRPSAAQATWDADAGTFPRMSGSAVGSVITFTGNTTELHRLSFENTATTSTSSAYLLNMSGSSSVVSNCQAIWNHNTVGAISQPAFKMTGTFPKINGLYCKGSSSTTGATIIGDIVYIGIGSSDGYVSNLTIDALNLAKAYNNGTNYYAGTALTALNTSNNKSLIIENYTLNMLTQPTAHQGNVVNVTGGSVRMFDVTVNAQTNSSYEGPGVFFTASAVDSCIVNLRATGNVGSIIMGGSCGFIEAYNWNIAYPLVYGSGNNLITYGTSGGPNAGGVTSPLVVGTGTSNYKNVLKISNGVFSTASNGSKLYFVGSGHEVYLNYCDFNTILKATNSNQNYDVVSINHNRVLGAFHYENRFGTLDSSNTYRTGGANFSFKGTILETDQMQNRRALPISIKTRETASVNLAAGSNTLTLYGSYKNYVGTIQAAPTLRDIGFTFDWWDNTNTIKTTSTFADGALTSDSSTWNNDPGVTPFKVSITITAALAQTIDINMFVSPEYDASGYFYIDPIIVVS